MLRTANPFGSQQVARPKESGVFQNPSPGRALRAGSVRGPLRIGARTVPVRSCRDCSSSSRAGAIFQTALRPFPMLLQPEYDRALS